MTVRLRARLLACALVSAVALSACGVRGADLGTSSSPCFQALPAAFEAVHHQGRLVGVRLEKRGSRGLRQVPGHESLEASKVCLVAFRGDFDAASLDHPLSAVRTVARGPFALVAVTSDGKRLLGTLVMDRLPIGFRHL